ncbi:MAG: hypothetical protein EOO61_08900 [Hymenobacter sp.]|nr:MAG: hypothetical protein EOO61_08900 [Hymenobacter sp.]
MPTITREEAADLLEFINDAEHIVYALNSKYILINYLYASIITTDIVSEEMEAVLQALRSRKIGSLRIIKASVLEQRMVRELPEDQRRRWLSCPRGR